MVYRVTPSLALLLMTACAKAPPEAPVAPVASVPIAASPGASSAPGVRALPALDLPRATNATAGRVGGTVVTIVGNQLLVGGVKPGADDDLLVATLRARADSWKDSHAGAPAVLGLRLPRTTAAAVVKRVFRSAALAGYSKVAIAVEAAGGEAHLDVDTSAPAPPGLAEPEQDLHLFLVADTKVAFSWRQGPAVVSSLDVPWSGAFDQGLVAARVESEWKLVGTHRDPSDQRLDRAVVSATDDADLAAFVATVDAILATKRSFAGTAGPAFTVAYEDPEAPAESTFGFTGQPRTLRGPSVRMGRATVRGKLPPSVIPRIVRQSLGRFRLCYENGLRGNPGLAGEIVVRFTIRADGDIGAVNENSATLKDRAVSQCVLRAFKGLSFPMPEGGGTVDVLSPITFAPDP